VKYSCQSNLFSEPFSTVQWELRDHLLLRNGLDRYPLKSISNIRLSYFPGGRGPARFCCSFALHQTGDRKQGILSFTEAKDPEQYRNYHVFVKELIARVSAHNPAFKLHTGLSYGMYSFYAVLLSALLLLPAVLAGYDLLNDHHVLRISLLMILPGWPLLRSLIVHYPRIVTSINDIPGRDFPTPKEVNA
jgi:hypothetical protein